MLKYPSISVVICTYKRPDKLHKCIESVIFQEKILPFEIVIIDNDKYQSAASVVESYQTSESNIFYYCEPEQNISFARNLSVKQSRGELLAFIDDDEIADSKWLLNLLDCYQTKKVNGVLGEVVYRFPDYFPDYIKESQYFKRIDRKDLTYINIGGGNMGNALIERKALLQREPPFNIHLGKTGGEDTEFFNFLINRGFSFYRFNKAKVYEIQENKRINLKWYFIRGYRGGWGFSRNITASKKFPLAQLLISKSVLGGFSKILINCLLNFYRPHYILLSIVSDLAGQIGKLGYFLNGKIEEYK